jgi:hypothetical protein
MKINVEFDLTPVEFREIFGLPDVRPVQKEMMDKIREKMLASVENYDPLNFLAPYLSENMQTMEQLQRAMWEGLAASAKPKKEK